MICSICDEIKSKFKGNYITGQQFIEAMESHLKDVKNNKDDKTSIRERTQTSSQCLESSLKRKAEERV